MCVLVFCVVIFVSLLKNVFPIDCNENELSNAMREMQSSDRVGCQLIDIVCIENKINQNGQELKGHEAKMNAWIDLVEQNWAARKSEHKMTDRPH